MKKTADIKVRRRGSQQVLVITGLPEQPASEKVTVEAFRADGSTVFSVQSLLGDRRAVCVELGERVGETCLVRAEVGGERVAQLAPL